MISAFMQDLHNGVRLSSSLLRLYSLILSWWIGCGRRGENGREKRGEQRKRSKRKLRALVKEVDHLLQTYQQTWTVNICLGTVAAVMSKGSVVARVSSRKGKNNAVHAANLLASLNTVGLFCGRNSNTRMCIVTDEFLLTYPSKSLPLY